MCVHDDNPVANHARLQKGTARRGGKVLFSAIFASLFAIDPVYGAPMFVNHLHPIVVTVSKRYNRPNPSDLSKNRYIFRKDQFHSRDVRESDFTPSAQRI